MRFSTAFYRRLTEEKADFEHAATVALQELRQDVGDEKIELWSPFLPLVG